MFDWGSSLSSDWNTCVQNYFFDDFRAAVRGHKYSRQLIPSQYLQEREDFMRIYKTHMTHLKKIWTLQQRPTDHAQRISTQKNSSRNSRIMTVNKMLTHGGGY